jgi:hypothetical protein
VYLTGVTVPQAREALSVLADGGLNEKVSLDEANRMVRKLMEFFSHQKFPSSDAAEAFAKAITSIVTEHTGNAVIYAFHPKTGLPRKVEFLSIHKVATELEAAEARFIRIAAHARHVINEDECKKREAEEDAKFAARGTPEERAKRVAELMNSLKAVPVKEPVASKAGPGFRPSPEVKAELAALKERRAAEEASNGA